MGLGSCFFVCEGNMSERLVGRRTAGERMREEYVSLPTAFCFSERYLFGEGSKNKGDEG